MYLHDLERLYAVGNFDRINMLIDERFRTKHSNFDTLSALRAMQENRQLPKLPTFQNSDIVYKNAINTLSSELNQSNRATFRNKQQSTFEIPTELDFIGQDAIHDHSPMQVLNFLSTSRVKSEKAILLVACFRNDGPYIIEWIAHHKALGFENICLFSNDNEDGSDLLLQALADEGVITFVRNTCGADCHPQRKAFGYVLEMMPLAQSFEWVAFLDSDELLILREKYKCNVNELIAQAETRYPGERPAAICMNWKFFSGLDARFRNAPLVDRFPLQKSSQNSKSIIRRSNACSMFHLHIPIPKKWGFFVDSDLEKYTPYELNKAATHNYSGGQVNHYWSKSFEEFLVKKARGESLVGSKTLEFSRSLDDYFNYSPQNMNASLDALPECLLERIREERAELLGSEAIRLANDFVTLRFQKLVERISNGLDIDTMFADLSSKWNQLRGACR